MGDAAIRRRPLWRIRREAPGQWLISRRLDVSHMPNYYSPWMPFYSGAAALAAFDACSREPVHVDT